MKNTLFIATYYNNPQFIEWQYKSFKKYVEDDFDFTVLDDSEDSTRSIISNGSAREEIRNECIKYGARHLPVPQSIHAYEMHGGYVPNENPTVNHPTERHQALMRWLFRNYKQLGFDQYKTLVLLDADVFIRQPINIFNYMTHDIIGSSRSQHISLPLGSFPDKMFPEKVKQVNNTTIQFFTFCIMCINMQKVQNLETIDVGSWPQTDTGSRTNFFIKENPQYTYAYMSDRGDAEFRTELYSKDPNFTHDSAEFLHYRGGSNWSYENTEYCRLKLNKVLVKYFPGFTQEVQGTHQVQSRDGEHIIK